MKFSPKLNKYYMKKNYIIKNYFNSIKNIRICNTVFVLIVFFLGFYKSFGQSSDCAINGTAGQLIVGTTCSPVTFNSTNNTNYWNSATGCNSGDNDDAWGWFDATSTNTTIQYTSTNDAILHLFTGTCATNMTHIACANANTTGTETITYTTVIGTRYLIRIQRNNSDNNMNGTICVFSPPPPTITSISPSSGCVGSNITITGTNLIGATAANLRIGGTPVSSITSNNGTTLVAVIGAGTTGTVSVTTAGGTATSIGTFTVNPLPAVIGGGAASVCTGTNTAAFTNASAGGTWSIVNGTGSASITAGGIVTGTTAGTVTVVYTLPSTCSVSRALTVLQTPGAISGGATSICVGSTTPAFTNPYSGGTWSVTNGTGSASINAGGLLTGNIAGTVTVNYTIGACTAATFAVTVNPTPAAPTAPVNSAITNSGFTVTWAPSAGGAGTISYILEVYTDAGFTTPIVGSPFSVGTPVTYAVTGLNSATTYYYRIKAKNTSCDSGYLTGSVLTGCTTPSAQPTALTFNTLTSTSLNGSFTAASPAPSGYLIVRSNGATPPTLTNGVTYAVGSTALGVGTLVIQGSAVTSNTTSFTSGTLTSNTRYYYHVFSYNNSCTGAPIYNSSTPLSNSAITCPVAPTAPVNSTITGSGFTVTWTASAAGGNAAPIEYILEVSTNAGFTSPIAGSPFSVGTAVTYVLTGLNSLTIYYYRIKANNESCDSSYLNGNVTTLLGNDECSGAIALTVSTSCSYTTYSNSGATGSTGMTAPGCANYLGGDVWFSAVVPATGVLTVDLQTGVMTDSGMAFYSGTCGSLTLLECDDDDSTNGFMSNISMAGLTPGQTIFIRVWEWGNDNNGTFGICATTPSCPAPANLYATILSSTSVTVNWPITTPPSSGGYQYFINTTGTAPITGSTPTGSTAAGVTSVTLTGLTPGQKYYIWVRSLCGGSDTSSWFGPTNYTPCAVGNGTGTTTLDCPAVISGGLGLNGGTPPTMSCQALGCVDLEANYLQINQPTNYSVSSIPYAPPYQFTCLQNPVSVNVDDIWSPMINLPFNFCFYGNNYNRCLIGSNGVITFDTTTYAPGGYNNWSFSNDLPNASLLRNTIFGVYHDIDPSAGGQVGWELITLNTGCRALVAAWNDIPMFSSTCNTQLYTGMIVLYENTNVIEVYVKEKNTCASWNSGNAIVGIQNGAGTAAVVAPNRNGLSADWTVRNEAWRFTPTGTTLTTLKWFEGNGTSGTQIGTTNSINVCPTVTTTYTAEVTYALCNGTNLKYTDNVVVNINGNKIWNGGTNTNWNEGSNWTPSGVPTSAHCVVIPDVANDPIISNTPNAIGNNLSVHNNAQLTMNAGQNLIITDKITVQPNAIFTVNNNANLIQINDSAVNTGSIRYKRIAPNIKGSDYVYWSSPVNNQDMGTIYDSTFPYNSGFKYQWNTTLNNTNGASGNISQGRWEAASGIMTMGRGYIIRGSSSFGMPASSIPTTFIGVPFNGAIPYTVNRGSYTGAPYNGANGVQITNLNDNYNLIGNPYPSSINALKFLQTNAYNASTNPTGKILGNVKLWTHGTDPVPGGTNPFYGSFQYNYNANDYLTINYLGSTTPGRADLIRAGQAFFVQMIDGAAGSGTVNFNNSMRYDATLAPYSNSGFFKNANTVNNEFTIERHRLWLDLVDSNSQSSGILVGYAADATNEYDNLFDAPTSIPSSLKLFSTITNDTNVFEIQGRSLPFDINDEIPIGINVPTQGNYSFAIGALDGLFEDQNIYLKDTMLNITHDLKSNPYTFTTSAGVTLDRFKIVYINNALGNPNYSIDNAIKVLVNNEVAVSSSNLQMESIEVFNILGQKLQTYNNINGNYFTLLNLHKNNTTLLLRIKLQTGETVIEKIIY